MIEASKTKREWCATLAKLTAPMDPATAAAAFLAMLPMLEFTDAAFNRRTLEACARRDDGDTAVPNFDKIARVFGELAGWARYSARREALTGPPDERGLPHLDARDKSWLETWQREAADGFASKDPTPRYDFVEVDTSANHRRAHVASMVRHFSPKAWMHIQAGAA